MTSATKELRRLLDERGVKWSPSAWDRSTETYWKTSDGNGCLAVQGETKLRLSFADHLTPAQAIDATLGRGTCRDVGRYAFVCSECGWASDEPHHVLGGFWPKYCPECGRAVVE